MLVILVLRFVSMVGDGRNDPLRHALSSRMLLFGSIMAILCTVQILAGILDGWAAASAILFTNSWFPLFFALSTFCGYFSEVCIGSPTSILSMGSFAPNQQPMIWFEALRWWAYVTCLSPLVFIFDLPYWPVFHIPDGLSSMLLLLLLLSLMPIAITCAILHMGVLARPLRWTLVSNQQQHASSQHHRNVAIKVECVAQRFYYDNILRAFRGSIPPERQRSDDSERGDRNAYLITNPGSETIVLVTPEIWVELTPEDPDSFLDAIYQALNHDPELSIEGGERSTRFDSLKEGSNYHQLL